MAALVDLIRRMLHPEAAVCLACGVLRVDDVEKGLCRACAEALCVLEEPERNIAAAWLDGCVSAYAYGDTARQLVRALKYGSVVSAARALSEGMRSVLPAGGFDAAVPVPLHRRRARRRGFNQARVLAEAYATPEGLPVLDALVRIRSTRTQTHLSVAGRAKNVGGAFARLMPVAGLRLLLIDDVLTTGATADACAAILKAGGAVSVTLLTAARAEGGDGD